MSPTVKEEGKNVSIRRLKKKDRTMLTTLISKLAETTGKDDIVSMLPKAPSEGEEDETQEKELNRNVEIISLAFNLLEGMVKYIEGDITPWFMSLVECKEREVYEELDFDIELQIIHALLESKDFTDFFSKGSQVRRGILNFVSRLKRSSAQ